MYVVNVIHRLILHLFFHSLFHTILIGGEERLDAFRGQHVDTCRLWHVIERVLCFRRRRRHQRHHRHRSDRLLHVQALVWCVSICASVCVQTCVRVCAYVCVLCFGRRRRPQQLHLLLHHGECKCMCARVLCRGVSANEEGKWITVGSVGAIGVVVGAVRGVTDSGRTSSGAGGRGLGGTNTPPNKRRGREEEMLKILFLILCK